MGYSPSPIQMAFNRGVCSRHWGKIVGWGPPRMMKGSGIGYGLDHFLDELKLGCRSIDPDQLGVDTLQVFLPLFQIVLFRIITEMDIGIARFV